LSSLNDIRRAAMNLLARREHSADELLRKLKIKKFPESDIQIVLDQLVQEKLISHERFLENYIHSRRVKGYGPVRIRLELLERGIEEELIEHHLNLSDNIWLIDARNVWQKKFKNHMPTDFKTRAQQMRFLQYRGFTLEQIEKLYD
jgi:regulatory protein